MTSQPSKKEGVLYIVATPIGNLADMVPRAQEVLQTVDLIAAEDTRHSGKLAQHFNITTPMIAYHEHSEGSRDDYLLQQLLDGKHLALISDAGTPLISDPGYRLVRLARAHSIRVTPIPGACALVAALSASGLPSDRFSFEGFLPAKTGARLNTLNSLVRDERTLIFYEAPHRLLDSLRDFETAFGGEREMALARELSKTYETFLTGSIGQVRQRVEQDAQQQRGEIVLLLRGFDRPSAQSDLDDLSMRVVQVLIEEGLSVKQTASITARITGARKNQIYQWALSQSFDPPTV